MLHDINFVLFSSPAAMLDAVRNPTPLSVLQRFMETRNPTEVTDLVDTLIDEVSVCCLCVYVWMLSLVVHFHKQKSSIFSLCRSSLNCPIERTDTVIISFNCRCVCFSLYIFQVDWEEYNPPLYREEWGRLVRYCLVNNIVFSASKLQVVIILRLHLVGVHVLSKLTLFSVFSSPGLPSNRRVTSPWTCALLRAKWLVPSFPDRICSMFLPCLPHCVKPPGEVCFP